MRRIPWGVLLAGALGWGAARALRAHAAETATVLYDGACPICRGAVARLRRWDARGRLRYLDARDVDEVAARFPHLPPDPALREMRLVFPDGVALGGFDAARALATLLPPLYPLAPVLFLPGIRPLGAAVYRFIAAHRPQTFTCTAHACDLPERT